MATVRASSAMSSRERRGGTSESVVACHDRHQHHLLHLHHHEQSSDLSFIDIDIDIVIFVVVIIDIDVVIFVVIDIVIDIVVIIIIVVIVDCRPATTLRTHAASGQPPLFQASPRLGRRATQDGASVSSVSGRESLPR
jgi:hypothetical protein